MAYWDNIITLEGDNYISERAEGGVGGYSFRTDKNHSGFSRKTVSDITLFKVAKIIQLTLVGEQTKKRVK